MSISQEYKDIKNWINFRHAPTIKRFEGYPIPQTFDVFDWVVWIPKDRKACRMNGRKPESILCASNPISIDWVLNKSIFDSKPILVVGGTDHRLSEYIDDLSSNTDRFSAIFFESKDVGSEKIKSISMGFNASYLQACQEENILSAIEMSDNQDKTEMLFCAWGKIWPSLDKNLPDRISANEFLKDHPKFKRVMVDNKQYWQVLAKYFFSMCPAGNGVQAPKLAESWMVKTVPVVLKNASFVDLNEYGYPFILLDSWDQINDQAISDWLEYYQTIDWNQVRYQLTNSYLHDFLSSQKI